MKNGIMRGMHSVGLFEKSLAVILAAAMLLVSGCSGIAATQNPDNGNDIQSTVDDGGKGSQSTDSDNENIGNQGTDNGSENGTGQDTDGGNNNGGTPGGALGTIKPVSASVTDLMKGRNLGLREIALEAGTEENCNNAIAEFSMKFLRETLEGNKENLMVSPVSLIYALAMAATGAKGDTLKEAESVFGQDLATLNLRLGQYMSRLNSLMSEDLKINIADSIWFRDRLPVKESYLNENASTLGAQIYQAAFDQGTVDAINAWVDANTYGMINELIDELSEEDMMVLINAVAVKAKWQEPFAKDATREDNFYREDGKTEMVDMMRSMRKDYYIEDEHASGFIKDYTGGLAFAALMPEEGMTVGQYLETLTGTQLRDMLSHPLKCDLALQMPKFTGDCDIDLEDVLGRLGLKKMMSPEEADFTGISDEPLYVGGGVQKTYIKVDEEGTEAAAVTGIKLEASGYTEPQYREVILNRPFVYVIFDKMSRLPLFIGVYQQSGK